MSKGADNRTSFGDYVTVLLRLVFQLFCLKENGQLAEMLARPFGLS